jgi:Kef-type K+ transport system membrane component KefB
VISEKLKSLREFFLILFFFAVGAKFNIYVIKNVFLLSTTLAVVLLLIKPILFAKGFILSNEDKDISKELSWRLGQASEFSLIVAAIALSSGRIINEAAYVIQLTVIITFIVSTYLVSQKYKTPISLDKHKLKD